MFFVGIMLKQMTMLFFFCFFLNDNVGKGHSYVRKDNFDV